ncbi:hypothetical protein [Rhizobium sp. FKY42]|uniref:hypothetical protein n=1 Tax=Rhizobium sp. FKY42 TaxID=2562310 RepID=UPI0010C08AD3|nr:hypothetical protein [Rhizobium sp. FKY42]
MTDNDNNVAGLPPEDKMGFAVPKTPAHSLMLLNSYMRTDMLQHIHSRLHKMRDADEPGSPLHHVAISLEQVINTWDGINLFECFTRNPFHIDPDYEFRPEQDYLHDIRLMKHHLKHHRKMISELGSWR